MGGTVGVSVAGAIFTAGVAAAMGAGINPNDVLAPEVRATLSPTDLSRLQAVLASSLQSVYVLFVGIGALSLLVAAFLPGGAPPREADDRPTQSEAVPSAAGASAAS
jgi:hypothetical protein